MSSPNPNDPREPVDQFVVHCEPNYAHCSGYKINKKLSGDASKTNVWASFESDAPDALRRVIALRKKHPNATVELTPVTKKMIADAFLITALAMILESPANLLKDQFDIVDSSKELGM